MSAEGFAHLHVHSHYSLLEAVPKLDALIEAAKADGQTALALTDHGNMYGSIEFYKECTKAGITPIIGVDFFVAPRTRHDKEQKTDERANRLVLLAKDAEGYHNLVRLVSRSYIEGFFERPRIDRELIELYKTGLICILPALEGEHIRGIEDGAPARAQESLAWYRAAFDDDCYAEITHHPEIEGHDARMRRVAQLATDAHIPLIAAHEIYYLSKDDAIAREMIMKIRNGGSLERDTEELLPDFSFMTREKMEKAFAAFPEALTNAAKVAASCTLELTLGKAIFPVFPLPAGTTDNAVLREMAEAGIATRGLADTPALRERMDYELGIIEKKGYASYFLIVADLLQAGKRMGIYTNTRGSAAGSLVSYLCGITTVDPIKFNMPFERFLNPERPSAPDIDMDIADNRRDDLINYAREKYGDDHVVQIGTFGTMMARAAVRDVSRALGHSYGTGDRLAKMIPFGKQGFPVTIDSAIAETPELAQAYKRDPVAREILDLAKKIEGNARHVGVHAAGVVIAPGPVLDYVPIQPDPKGGKTITQYDMYSVADEYGGVGLLKFDFLGLTNLSVLADSVARVKQRLGIDVDLDRVSLDDKKVYAMLARGETLGVFQMAGSGMTAYLKELQPTVVHDLNAMVALYRPGPMAFIPDYIARKKNPRLVTYLDPRLESILKPTYGILIYQDDVMMMAVQLAGYSWGEADKFRKAMGKKIPEEMAKQKDRFLTGTVERGMKKESAQKLWEQIETFAAYGFNKAHAASYGNLAYKTAYMKANFPVDYMASVLTADAGDVEKIHEIISECARMKIDILPPSVNESFGTFTVASASDEGVRGGSQRDDAATSGFSQQGKSVPEDAVGDGAPRSRGAIRFGLYSIKNFGTGVADTIISAREKGGPFKDIGDFLARVEDKNLNKKQLESLIQCGAMDELGERGQLLASMDLLLSYHREHTKAPSAQVSLFAASSAPAPLSLPAAAPASQTDRLNWEKDLLGLFISGHPLDKFKAQLAKQKPLAELARSFPRGLTTVMGGFLETTSTILTKKGDKMLFGQLADASGAVEIVVFPKTLAENSALFAPGTCILVKGTWSTRNGEPSFAVDKVKALG
jgi:DNA polymerase-3 subunit alpha